MAVVSLLLAAAAGIAAHRLYFQRYEYQRHINALITLVLTAPLALAAVFARLPRYSITSTAAWTFYTSAAFMFGAIGSTLIYRAFFHPLNKFPGPYAARLTDFWLAGHVGKQLDQYRKLEVLHKKYGPYVRTGANQVSIIAPEILDLALSTNSVASKGPWYDIDYPNAALSEERDHKTHAARRRLWIPAFSDKALRAYEPHANNLAEKFVRRVGEFKGGPVNVSKWFNLYSFDFMGIMAFGKDYKMLDSGESHYALGLITNGLSVMGLTMPVWAIHLAKKLPFDSTGIKKFVAFCQTELTDAVRNMKKDEKAVAGSNVTSWLYRIYENEAHPDKNPYYLRDAILLVVAKSDTTAATLTYLFYLLAQHPEEVRNIRNELASCTQGPWSDKDIKNCQHLNGAINEALRLFHPGPSGLLRYTPPEGMKVGDVYLPGKITFNMPHSLIYRNESVFADPDYFIPERWYSKPELIRKPNCYYPFSTGSSGCLGKSLALMEIRFLTTKLLLKYDVALAPGEDGHRLLNESKDHFTMSLAPVDLVFTPRKS